MEWKSTLENKNTNEYQNEVIRALLTLNMHAQ